MIGFKNRNLWLKSSNLIFRARTTKSNFCSWEYFWKHFAAELSLISKSTLKTNKGCNTNCCRCCCCCCCWGRSWPKVRNSRTIDQNIPYQHIRGEITKLNLSQPKTSYCLKGSRLAICRPPRWLGVIEVKKLTLAVCKRFFPGPYSRPWEIPLSRQFWRGGDGKSSALSMFGNYW